MNGQVVMTQPRASRWGGGLSPHRHGWVERAAAVQGRVRDAWLPRVAVVLGWAVVMLLAGTALVFAVATLLGYQWPGVLSPALPTPQTPEPGF